MRTCSTAFNSSYCIVIYQWTISLWVIWLRNHSHEWFYFSYSYCSQNGHLMTALLDSSCVNWCPSCRKHLLGLQYSICVLWVWTGKSQLQYLDVKVQYMIKNCWQIVLLYLNNGSWLTRSGHNRVLVRHWKCWGTKQNKTKDKKGWKTDYFQCFVNLKLIRFLPFTEFFFRWRFYPETHI